MAPYEKKIEAAKRALYDYVEQQDQAIEVIPESEMKKVIAAAAGGAAHSVFKNFLQKGYFEFAGPEFGDGEAHYNLTDAFFHAVDEILYEQTGISGKTDGYGKSDYAHFKDSLLIALAQKEDVDGAAQRGPKSVADEALLEYKNGWVRKAIYDFENAGYIKATYMKGGHDAGIDCELTGEGMEAARRYIADRELKSFRKERSSVANLKEFDIPAADRIVLQNHNSAPYKQAVGAVDAVIEAVRKDNEYGARDDEDRDQRIAELKAGAELLKSNWVEVSKIEAVLIKTLAYLTGIGVAVSECAAAIEALKALFGLQCMALPI